MTETACGVVEARCVCALAEGHDGPHVCACAGSWEWKDGKFRVVNWPTIAQPGSAFADLFGDFTNIWG